MPGVDVFEEVFKLIFTKLYDEFKSQNDKMFIDRLLRQNMNIETIPDDDFRAMEFRNTGQTDTELKTKIQHLFKRRKKPVERRFSRILNV